MRKMRKGHWVIVGVLIIIIAVIAGITIFQTLVNREERKILWIRRFDGGGDINIGRGMGP